MNPSLLLVICTLGLAHAGFRCTLGNWACTASCVTLGQTSGICDAEGDCICSEKSISLKNFKKLLPSRCNLGQSFCEVTCNSIGRKNGTCGTTDSGGSDCECSEDYLSPSDFALCGAESTCRLDCQRQGLATGECFGWSCKCQSKDDATLPVELEDLKPLDE
eukprot:TRINITY_DN2046_c0_g1_i1.p1 TRINITY_DN2046_c0_g1~~TRINITY_DN2046_c0_g1_i1.p1  ORF type:complete len:162 (-),score=44.14 TRINITY_DN2046_c0_g1_i1:93-578(-)